MNGKDTVIFILCKLLPFFFNNASVDDFIIRLKSLDVFRVAEYIFPSKSACGGKRDQQS